MASHTGFLLFTSSGDDLGWSESAPPIPGLSQEVDHLHNAIVCDLAERFVEYLPYNVRLLETSDTHFEPVPPIPARVECRTQTPGLLSRRVQEAAKDALESGEVSSLVVFLGRNPLYPLQLLTRGIELLSQEDDVIVLGEAVQERHHPSIMWLGLKSYHPEIFEQNERWWQGGTPLLQAAVDANALVMTLRPVRDITSVGDLGFLFHEVEREVLLKQWYPVRTYEALWKMRRKHLISENPE
jgi:hypothetical protein